MKKPGRNDPCPCGSRKKYKLCCLQASGGEPARSAGQEIPGTLQAAFAHHQAGRLTQAETLYRQILRMAPDHPDALHLLGLIARQTGKYETAVELIGKAIALVPDFAVAHNNLGNALKDLGRLDEAVASFREALRLKPDYAEAHNNLGNALEDRGKLDEAVASFREALRLRPDFAVAHNNLGAALKDQGKLDEAAACFRQAIFIKPDFSEAFSNFLFCISHAETADTETLFSEHRRFGEQFEEPLRIGWQPHANSRDPERCLRVGFVSGDLRNHAVASFIEPVLMYLANYVQLSLHAYSNHPIEDEVTRRLRTYFRYWHPIAGLSDADLAEKIRKDSIDILIDLSGHTAKNRLLVFARKPAPIQASWMGYPGTTGLKAMDYFLADRFRLPAGQFDWQFTEKIVLLPVSAPFLPYENAPPVNALPALRNGHLTFGSFNRPSKLNRSAIALWSRLLHALPDSRMMLGAMTQDGSETLSSWFLQEGIAGDRLGFFQRCGMADYLAQYQQVDMCLNAFPYNGGTTICHALWMGVPTLTLAGQTVPSRGGVSILGHVGLEEFIAQDAADFLQKGLSWAGNLSGLADLRTELRGRFERSAMSQPAVAAAGVERALRIMWQRWCAGLPAAAFEVEPIHTLEGVQ